MRKIIDRIILFAICFYFLTPFAFSFEFYMALFSAIFVVMMMMGVRNKIASIIGCTLYTVMAFVSAELFWTFLPLIVYELFETFIAFDGRKMRADRGLAISLGALAVCILNAVACRLTSLGGADTFLFVVILMLAAFMASTANAAKVRDKVYEHAQNEERALKDLIKNRQQEMQKEQDTEVHLATLSERNRIAREIHDNVGHVLSRALIMSGALEVMNKQPELTESIGELKETLSGAMESVRKSVHDLRDESIDLEAAVRSVANEFTFCPVDLDLDSGWYMDKNTKYCVVSMIREALTNTAKHSNATKVRITLRAHEELYQLLIEDNGTVSINSDGTGMGLDSMRDRVKALHGTFYYNNESGFRIFATFPRK